MSEAPAPAPKPSPQAELPPEFSPLDNVNELIDLVIELQGGECNSSFYLRQIRHREMLKLLIELRTSMMSPDHPEGIPSDAAADAQAAVILSGAVVVTVPVPVPAPVPPVPPDGS